ncbi:MAG TPA: TolC family protein [bacterium]|nr:TolC family protein [bacterium]
MKKGYFFIIVGFLFILCGCSVKYYEKSAEKDIKEIWDKSYKKVEEKKLPDSILQEDVFPETRVLDLSSAIKIGLENNRNYKSRKENVYIKILDYTYQKYLLKERYGIGGDISSEKSGDETIGADLNFNLIKLLSNGAKISFDITQDFLKYFTGNKEKDFQTFLSLNFFQPILRGAGKDIALEGLTQAERNVIYEIRDFLRYEKQLSTDIAKKYLSLVAQKKNIETYRRNYEFLKKIRERNENLAQAGRLSPMQVDMANQDEYSASQRWITASNNYKNAVDSFKIYLGIQPTEKIEIEDKQVEDVLSKGIQKFDIDLTSGTEVALKNRLDLITFYDMVADAERQVKIAINNLKGTLNLNMSIESGTEKKSRPTFDLTKPEYSAGLEFELPIDKLPERNAYKKSLISLDRAKRNFEEKKDNVKLEVIENYRNLEEAYQSHLIQRNSLNLAEKRVDSTDLLFQAGRAETRDLLEAQNAYLSAETSLTSASINYISAYLDYLLSCEMIEVDIEKVWKGDKYEEIFGKIDKK